MQPITSEKYSVFVTPKEYDGKINCLTISQDGAKIATGGSDGQIKIWAYFTNTLMRNLIGHKSEIVSLDFSNNSYFVISACREKNVKVWNYLKEEILLSLDSFQTNINYVDFSKFGKMQVGIGCDSGHLFIYDLQMSLLRKGDIYHSDTITSIEISQDGSKVLTVSKDKTIRIYSLQNNKLIKVLKGHKSKINHIAFSRQENKFLTASDDKTIKVWDFNQGLLKTFQGHTKPVLCAAFSQDTHMIVSGSSDIQIIIWNYFSQKKMQVMTGHFGGVNSVLFSENDERIVSASDDRKIKIWEVKTGKILANLVEHTGFVNSIQFSEDYKTLISASDDGCIKLWNFNDFQLITSINGDSAGLTQASISRCKFFVVSSSQDKTIKLYNTYQGNRLQVFNSHKDKVLNSKFLRSLGLVISTSSNVIHVTDLTPFIHDYSRYDQDIKQIEFLKYLDQLDLEGEFIYDDVEYLENESENEQRMEQMQSQNQLDQEEMFLIYTKYKEYQNDQFIEKLKEFTKNFIIYKSYFPLKSLEPQSQQFSSEGTSAYFNMGCGKYARKGRTAKNKAHNRAMKHRHIVKQDDQIYEDLKPENQEKFQNMPVDEELPGLGQHYCIPCAKYFQNEVAIQEHQKSKKHKVAVKRLKEKPYDHKEAEECGRY
ncbi:WD40-repeat-containing domain [Pseudocohnilembus persalinus]|uniref:WD40-repeat-containing domain n=1 Tax=Pseudocohnilembus persalinus TaxID=266149 RepID=A0A0V0R987_PSEPJ|nr:WD40-repeat-containing domain [Pseudocohnilembus persalinus]|eukprot:KRX11069.1 WD40-repeat-containing domain [Pseudocohnilembus persalinus]